MAKDRETTDASGTSQSKRPPLNHFDSTDPQPSHYRAKTQKHIVGGGGRFHARVPSTKALHKHHAAPSTTKLNRRQGSLSPERAAAGPLVSSHRRATSSDLKLARDASSSSLKKNSSQTSLKRNRSQADVTKKSRSSANLMRSSSHSAVAKLKSTTGSKVHFNIGDDGQDDEQDDDEWQDASTSASPLLSRRGSTINGGVVSSPPANRANNTQPTAPFPHRADTGERPSMQSMQGANGLTLNLAREIVDHNQYLTSRILQRTSSPSAPPKMSTDNVLVHPSSSRPHSPDSILHEILTPSSTPHIATHLQTGSSGMAELTSRFLEHNSHDSGSGIPGVSFLTSAIHGGLSRAPVNGKTQAGAPRRPRSLGNLAQARDQVYEETREHEAAVGGAHLSDGERFDNGVPTAGNHRRPNGVYAIPRDMNRTQQKLNLQRASSTLETAHPHPGVGIGLAGVPVTARSLTGSSSYDSRDPRLAKLRERIGMEYLVVRRFQNPVARSLARLSQLPGLGKTMPKDGQASSRPGTSHSKRGSEVSGRPAEGSHNPQDSDIIGPSAAAMLDHRANRRPTTPRETLSDMQANSSSPSVETDDGAGTIHEGQGLGRTSLTDGEDEANTLAILRSMWEKPVDLSAS
ncbi:hypothetical protein B0T26DRAFT_615547, partial [Lasiosphaeria miniovina]